MLLLAPFGRSAAIMLLLAPFGRSAAINDYIKGQVPHKRKEKEKTEKEN